VMANGPFIEAIVSDDLAIEDLPPLLEALEAGRKRGPFVVLTDTTQMKSAPRPVLKAFADALKQLPPMKKIWVADAVVLNSAVTRFLLSTLILIAPIPTEVKVFERREEAERWCRFMLRKAGVKTEATV
jgi:hypothetical protein